MVEHPYRISTRDFFGQLAIMSILFAVWSWPKPVLADVPSVALRAKWLGGGEFEVIINVSHEGNTALHHVNKVVLFADGEEVKVWKYSSMKRPEAVNFLVKAKVVVTKDTVFSAVTNCNQHGENKDSGRLLLSPIQLPE